MKNMIKLAAVTLVLAGAVAQSSAQDTITLTDRASNLNVALTGYVQGEGTETSSTVEKVRITSKDIVNWAQGGKGAKLLIVTPVDYDGDTRVVVRERGAEDTDLSGYFGASTHALVEQSQTRNDKVTGKQYSIDTFFFGGSEEDPTPVGFEVQGFTSANISNGSFSSSVNGTGYTGAGDAVLTGKISGSGGKEETFIVEITE